MKLEMFLKQNSIKKENMHFIASDRFCENGKCIPWEIRAISAREDMRIRESCMKNVFDEKEKRYKSVFDSRGYALKLCAASTVFPDLKDASLQESYGVMGEEQLLSSMLTAGEYEKYVEKVREINGFSMEMRELREEAKNL